LWESNLVGAIYDGADTPLQDGTTVAKAGSVVFISFDLTDDNGNPIILQDKGFAHVFVTKDITATNSVPKSDPRKFWIQVFDNNPNPDPIEMNWDPATSKLTMAWKTPRNGKSIDVPGLNVEGDWFGRITAFSKPIAGSSALPLVCDTSDPSLLAAIGDVSGNGVLKACLSGPEGNPSFGFLIDTLGTTLPAGERELATFKVKLTKSEPGEPIEDPPVPPPQDLPEMDDLLALMNNLVDTKDVNKGTGNNLRDILNEAKALFLTGVEVDRLAACVLIDDFEANVDSARSNKITDFGKGELIRDTAAIPVANSNIVQDVKGCLPDIVDPTT